MKVVTSEQLWIMSGNEKTVFFYFELQATSNINSVNLVFLVEIIYM